MTQSEKSNNARMFIAEYFRQLSTQERIVQRIVDQKWDKVAGEIEQMIDRKIKERLL